MSERALIGMSGCSYLAVRTYRSAGSGTRSHLHPCLVRAPNEPSVRFYLESFITLADNPA
jgi:hypothetical protein